MRDGDHEIRAFAAQRIGLRLDGCDRRRELQILRIGGARGIVECHAGQADLHAIERDDGAVREALNRLAIGIAQVRAEQRKFRFAHALEKYIFSKIEFMVAGHENVRLHEVRECDDMRATIKAGHDRGRQRVAAMRENHRIALGAL